MTFPMQPLTRFLLYWLVLTALALTVAGEKMPWLTVHIALPLAILAGQFVGDLLDRSDLRDDLPKLERLAPFLYAGLASALALIVFVIAGPFSLASFGGWILVIVAGLAVFWAFTAYSPTTALQVALVGLVAAFGVFTIRAGILAGWGHGDGIPPENATYSQVSQHDYGEVPVELLVYTQSSGDIPKLADEIRDYARQTGRGYQQVITVDASDGFTWPWAWYLREYKKVGYPSITTANWTPEPNAVLLVKKENVTNLSLPQDAYGAGIEYHHRRWFPEEYRGEGGGYSTQDFFRGLFTTSTLGDWVDYWIRRTPPAELGTVMGVAFFPSDFSADIPTMPVGPTVRTEDGQLVIGSQGSAPGQLSSPSDVAFDADGNIYVADTNNNRVSKYDAEGNFIAAAGGFNSAVQLNQPWSVAVAADGTVFIADTWAHDIVKLDRDLNEVKRWGAGGQIGQAGGDPFALFGPREITLTPDGNLIITDTGNGRVIEYTAEGDFVAQFGIKADTGATDATLNEPVGVVVSPNGDVLVADYWNKRVVRLSGDLQFVSAFDVPVWGSEAVTDRPYMALLADGRLLVTDPEHGKILAYNDQGTLLSEWELPAEPNKRARPVGIASDGTNVIVADGSGAVVRKVPLAEIAP
jgi:DNA-binding beta-propeller fold protein YncE